MREASRPRSRHAAADSAEQRLAIEHAAARALAESGDIAQAAPKIIRTVCETLGWACGARWVLDESEEALLCAETWSMASAPVEAFLEATRRIRRVLEPGGLIRRAWLEGEPVWIPDVTQDATFKRAPDAVKAGLHSAFAFPIKAGSAVIGVMEFFGREIERPDAALLECAGYVGSQIAQFLQRKKVEADAELLSVAINASPDQLFVVDPVEMRLVYVNDSACKATGLAREEYLKVGPWEASGITREQSERAYAEVIAKAGETLTSEVLVPSIVDRTKKGWFELQRRALRVGDRWLIVTSSREVTERKVAQQIAVRRGRMFAALSATNEAITRSRSPEELYQQVCDAAVHGGQMLATAILLAEPDTATMKVAAAAGAGREQAREVAVTVDEASPLGRGLVGAAFRSGQACVANDFLKDERTRPWWTAAEAAGIKSSGAVPFVCQGRTVGVLQLYSAQRRTFDDEAVKLLERMAQNIGFALGNFKREAERRAAEAALRVSEEKYRVILEDMGEPYYEVDLKGNLVLFNAAFCRFLGYPENEMMGMNNRAYQTPEIAAKMYKTFNEVYRTGVPAKNFDWEMVRKDGKDVLAEGSVSLVKDAQGEPAGFRGILRDVTERRYEERLLALEHAVARGLAEADTTSKVLQTVMRIVCESQQWEASGYWSIDERARTLSLTMGWNGAGAQTKTREYYKNSLGVTVSADGPLGSVWITGKPLWLEHVARDSTGEWQQKFSGGDHATFSFPVMAEGKVIGVLGFASATIREPDARLLQTVGVIGNQAGQFLQRKQAERVLRDSEARFRALTELSSDWYWEQDLEFRFTRVESRRGDKDTSKELLIGKRDWETGYEIKAEGGWDVYRALHEAHEPYRDVVMHRALPDGTQDYISVSGEPIFDAKGRLQGYRGVSREITEQKLAEERIQYLATHDGLTDLPNRVMFSELLNLELQTARRYKRRFAVLFIDLDRFKFVNDTQGHAAGDTLLKEMAARLKTTLRASDVVARVGGDEFVVLLQEAGDPGQAAAAARKILSAAMKPVEIAGQECRVTASIGICMYPADAQDEEALMKNADMAMYLAKEAGKNNYQFYSAEIQSRSIEKLRLETQLRHALERNELSLNYQAKLDLRTNAITGVEALLRWSNPELGAVSPMQFIPVAEETGLIVPIGKWVLRTACLQNAAWQREGLPPVSMAVNLSPRQFADPDLLADIAAALDEAGMAAGLLELEITESMVMHDADRAVALLGAIKALGLRLAIDDFGTGYSSLAQLKRFPIDTLKIDRSFIRDIPGDAEDVAITRAIIAMGRSLNLTVVAEGVETAEQQAFLREHACDEMQGYYFSKPVPPDQFAELLRSHAP